MRCSLSCIYHNFGTKMRSSTNLNCLIAILMLIVIIPAQTINIDENNNTPKEYYKDELYNAVAVIYKILRKHIPDHQSTDIPTNLPPLRKKSIDILFATKKRKSTSRPKENSVKYIRGSSNGIFPAKGGKHRLSNVNRHKVQNYKTSENEKIKVIKKKLDVKKNTEAVRSQSYKSLNYGRRYFRPSNSVSDKYFKGRDGKVILAVNRASELNNTPHRRKFPSTFQGKAKTFDRSQDINLISGQLKLKNYMTSYSRLNINHTTIPHLSKSDPFLATEKTLERIKGNSNVANEHGNSSDIWHGVTGSISMHALNVHFTGVKPDFEALNISNVNYLLTDKPSKSEANIDSKTEKEKSTNNSQVGMKTDYAFRTNSSIFNNKTSFDKGPVDDFRVRNKNKRVVPNVNFTNYLVDSTGTKINKTREVLFPDRKSKQNTSIKNLDAGLKQVVLSRRGRINDNLKDNHNFSSQVYYQAMNAVDGLFSYSSAHTLILVSILSIICLITLIVVILFRRFKNNQPKDECAAFMKSDNDYSPSFKKQAKKSKCKYESSNSKGSMKKYFDYLKGSGGEDNNVFFSIGSDSDSTEGNGEIRQKSKTENLSSNTYWFTENYNCSADKRNDSDLNYKRRELTTSENPCLKLKRLHRNLSKGNKSYFRALKRGKCSSTYTRDGLLQDQNLPVKGIDSLPFTRKIGQSKVEGNTRYSYDTVKSNTHENLRMSKDTDGDMNSTSSIEIDTEQNENELDPNNPFSESFTEDDGKRK